MNPMTSPTPVRRAGGWITGARRPYPPAARLFCLPHVGGAASEYEPWRGGLGDDVEVCAVELPGRQTRMRERPYDRIGPLVADLAAAIDDELDVPYALFGHSMGALVAFELARRLRAAGAPQPCALFVSGAPGPRLTRDREPLYDAPTEKIVAWLDGLGGLPEELRAEPALLECFLPLIRADFALVDTYRYRAQELLECPVVAFAGSDDEAVPLTRVAVWAEETAGRFEYHVLPGGHFFPRTARSALLDRVHGTLAATTRRFTRRAGER